MPSKKLIIIGSGVAGMASAIRLAAFGFDVTVYEANDYPGGKLSGFKKDGFQFDAGPSLFTEPDNIEELFTICGEDINLYFKYTKVHNTCNYFFENGKVIHASADPDVLENELREKLNETGDVKNYLLRSGSLYKNIGSVFVNHSLHKSGTWLHTRILNALKHFRFPYLFQTLHSYNKGRFSQKETIQIFNRYATYNGSNPYKAPAMLSLIPHLEFNTGTWYPEGGMISITNALYNLALRKGVTFKFAQQVQKIIHFEGKVAGIVCNNENIYADIVVSNADIYFTYKNLLHLEYKAKKLLKQERSSSALIFYWGISKSFPQLDLHNIFFSSDYQKEFNYLFHKISSFDDPTVYVNITSKKEPSLSPSGMENWFVMINVPSDNGQNWEEIKERSRKNIIQKLTRLLNEDISSLIVSESVLDPLLIEERTKSFKGSLYGTSSNTKSAAFVRHPNFNNQIKGMYFCGGSVHPGGGIPLCLRSAKIVSSIIQNVYQKNTH